MAPRKILPRPSVAAKVLARLAVRPATRRGLGADRVTLGRLARAGLIRRSPAEPSRWELTP